MAKTRRKRAPLAQDGAKWPTGSIAYICGSTKLAFNPSSDDLGGSEQAVVHLSKAWAQKGRIVVVFGNVKECKIDGVEYRHINKLNLRDTFDTAIFWRSFVEAVKFNGILEIRSVFFLFTFFNCNHSSLYCMYTYVSD